MRIARAPPERRGRLALPEPRVPGQAGAVDPSSSSCPRAGLDIEGAWASAGSRCWWSKGHGEKPGGPVYLVTLEHLLLPWSAWARKLAGNIWWPPSCPGQGDGHPAQAPRPPWASATWAWRRPRPSLASLSLRPGRRKQSPPPWTPRRARCSDVGPEIAASVREFFDTPGNQRSCWRDFKRHRPVARGKAEPSGGEARTAPTGPLAGKRFLFTGALDGLTRGQAESPMVQDAGRGGGRLGLQEARLFGGGAGPRLQAG